MKHPRSLPPEWFARWEERAAIVQEGCRLPATVEGTREANRLAFSMILAEMERDDDAALRRTYGSN